MKELNHTVGHRRLFRRRLFIGVGLFVLSGLTAAGLMWYGAGVDRAVNAQNKESLAVQQETQAMRRAYDTKQAELKAQQEAAAKQAAEDAKKGVSSDSNSKSCNTATTHNNPAATDVLVNKKHCIQPLSYAPSDLVSSNGATLSAR